MHRYMLTLVGFMFMFCGLLQAKEILFSANANTSAELNTQAVASNRGGVAPLKVTLKLGGIEINKTQEGFDAVNVKNLVPSAEVGAPETYTTGVLLGVPKGYDVELARNSKKMRTISNVVLQPVQEKYRCDCDAPNSFAFNSDIYNSGSRFPDEDVEIEEIGNLQGLRLVRLGLNALQMNFANQQLNVAEEIEVTVELVPNGDPIEAAELSPAFYNIARTVLANGQNLGELIKKEAGPEVMMVFVADDYKDSIAPLVEWKTQKGIKVVVNSLTEAGGSKESVKQVIQDYYDNEASKPSYLVFIGDGESMPPYKVSTGWQLATTDFPYSLLSGEDEIPDALYGRIVAKNLDEVTAQMKRWISYEKTPQSKADWYAKALSIASNEGFNPSDAEYAAMVRDALTKHTYTYADAFEQGEGNAKPAKIQEAVNEGRSWLAYFGHGDGTGWGSTNGKFSNKHVSELTNTEKLLVLIDVACANASYIKTPDNFGKAWVTHEVDGQSAGAVAFLGGSVNISWHEPAIMSAGIAKYHFEKPIHNLGGSVFAGQLHLLEKRGPSSKNFDNLKWYNLFGDPSLLIRTDTPKSFKIKTATALGQLKVIATNEEGAGLPQLTVALTKPDRSLVAVAKTNANGEAYLPKEIGQLEPGTLVTVTGYNTETVQMNVE